MKSRRRRLSRLRGASACVLALLIMASSGASGADRGRGAGPRITADQARARDLFEKVWVPGERSPNGGDGLGPLYNETSCVGCHHQGGVGGSGGNDRNVDLVTAVAGSPRSRTAGPRLKGELEELHPGFRTRKSLVVHKNTTDPALEETLRLARSSQSVWTREGVVELSHTERNTPSLFGSGRIDAVAEKALVEAEKREFPGFPEIHGRVARLPDGRAGRFGWKGQVATLHEFVLGACSNELGLEVPGHHQVSLAKAGEFRPTDLELDLTEEECRQITAFLRDLPAPIYRAAGTPGLAVKGREIFGTIGCSACHVQKMGGTDGLYSDLLLHDMGERTIDAGSYYSSGPPRVVDLAANSDSSVSFGRSGEAGPREWRTPPLWGVETTAPYFHDGRARTLDAAIRLHGGEAEKTSARYTQLHPLQKQALLAFLHSLELPADPRIGAKPRREARMTLSLKRVEQPVADDPDEDDDNNTVITMIRGWVR